MRRRAPTSPVQGEYHSAFTRVFPGAGISIAESARVSKFVPRYAEGYAFALLAALVYGVTPFLIRLAVIRGDLGSGIAGGLVSYAAATVAVALLLLLPGQWRHAREIKPESLKWFTYSGVSVSIAQMFIYMAYAVAPLTVVTPVLQLHHLLRLAFSRLLNPHHEIFGGRMILATALSLLGAVALSLDVEYVLSFMPLPDSVAAFARWHLALKSDGAFVADTANKMPRPSCCFTPEIESLDATSCGRPELCARASCPWRCSPCCSRARRGRTIKQPSRKIRPTRHRSSS